MPFKKAYFSRNTLFEIQGSEEDGVRFSLYRLRDDRTLDTESRVTVSPTSAELMAMAEAIKMYRKQGAEGFRRYVAWLTGQESERLLFKHVSRSGEASFGLTVLPAREGGTEKLGVVIKRGEESRTFPVDRLSMLSLLAVLEKKAAPAALEAEVRVEERVAAAPAQEASQNQEDSRDQEEARTENQEAQERRNARRRTRRAARETRRESSPPVPEADEDGPMPV